MMRCKQCGKALNPVSALMGPICGECARKNYREAIGLGRKEKGTMEVKAVGPGELVEELERLVEQRRRDKYSLQVKLDVVEFAFDEQAALTLDLDPEMSRIEQAERYLREGVLRPAGFVEDDGTVHQVLEWDSTPVAYSGFMGCVTHSVAVTDRGTFEVGRYPAMNIETVSKVWQWFIHRKVQRDEEDR